MDAIFTMPLEELRERTALLERAASASVMLANHQNAASETVVSVNNSTSSRVSGDKAAASEVKAETPPKRTRRTKKADAAEAPKTDETENRDPGTVGESDDDDADETAATKDDVTDAAKALVAAGQASVLKDIVTEFKIPKISEADPSQYPAILAKLKAAAADA